jgi:hypothetical protein
VQSTHLRKIIVDLEVNVCCYVVCPVRFYVFPNPMAPFLHGSACVRPFRLLNLTVDVYSAKIQQ